MIAQHEFEEAARRTAEYAADCIAVMRLQEDSDAYRRVDYLASLDSEGGHDQAEPIRAAAAPSSRPQQATKAALRPIDADCRRKMSDWCLKVVDYCDFDRETVSIAMAYLDRFLSSTATSSPHPRASACLKSRREYQLAAMTSLYLAVKLHEPLLTMDAAHVSDLSRGSYSAAEVTSMEGDILDALKWRTSDPTPLGFLARFVQLLPDSVASHDEADDDEDDVATSAEAVLLEMGRTQTELAMSDYGLAAHAHTASAVAIGALLNAIEAAGDFLLSPCEAMEFVVNVSVATGLDMWGEEIECVRSKLRTLVAGSGGAAAFEANAMARACSTTSSAAAETETETAMDSEAETEAEEPESVCETDSESESDSEVIMSEVAPTRAEQSSLPPTTSTVSHSATTQKEEAPIIITRTSPVTVLLGFGRSLASRLVTPVAEVSASLM